MFLIISDMGEVMLVMLYLLEIFPICTYVVRFLQVFSLRALLSAELNNVDTTTRNQTTSTKVKKFRFRTSTLNDKSSNVGTFFYFANRHFWIIWVTLHLSLHKLIVFCNFINRIQDGVFEFISFNIGALSLSKLSFTLQIL